MTRYMITGVGEDVAVGSLDEAETAIRECGGDFAACRLRVVPQRCEHPPEWSAGCILARWEPDGADECIGHVDES